MKQILLTTSLSLLAMAGLPTTSEAESLGNRHRALVAQISTARRGAPSTFQALAALKAELPELDRRKRGRLVAVMPRLRALGPSVLLPMLDELGSPRGEALRGTALTAWRVGLLETVGALRDPRSIPVLVRVLDSESDPAIVRAAAAALGNLGAEEAVNLLIARAGAASDTRQLALVAGIGECRRLPAARALAELLTRRPGKELARALAKALGELGNAWAWQTPRLAALGEGAAVRALAANALLDAFVRYPGAVRKAAETAILLVDDPGTLTAITRARAGAAPPLQAALAALADRVEHNPLRRGRPAK